jgi:drug/metabolite transporter (DMT)-like permease
MSIGIGTLLGMGNFVIIKALSLGAPQSAFALLFNPLYIVYGLIFGLVVWHEKVNLQQLGGAALAIAGIIIISYFRAV